MFADINVCEFAILKVFALLKFAILVLSKVNLVGLLIEQATCVTYLF